MAELDPGGGELLPELVDCSVLLGHLFLEVLQAGHFAVDLRDLGFAFH